jgi:hypothetical protein
MGGGRVEAQRLEQRLAYARPIEQVVKSRHSIKREGADLSTHSILLGRVKC